MTPLDTSQVRENTTFRSLFSEEDKGPSDFGSRMDLESNWRGNWPFRAYMRREQPGLSEASADPRSFFGVYCPKTHYPDSVYDEHIHDLFARLSAALGRPAYPNMFTGSFASSFHGTPRASNDFDLVMAPTPEQLRVLKDILPETGYYFDLEDALQEAGTKGSIQHHRSRQRLESDFIIANKGNSA
jgi:hypothetical protein